MGIEQICNSIKNFFSSVRLPLPDISKVLVVCTKHKKKGLSALQSTSNIVKDLAKMGIPTGSMPDGSPNLTVAFVYSAVQEEQRALKYDMRLDVGIKPGSLNIQGFGANAGGPVAVNCTNYNTGDGACQAR